LASALFKLFLELLVLVLSLGQQFAIVAEFAVDLDDSGVEVQALVLLGFNHSLRLFVFTPHLL